MLPKWHFLLKNWVFWTLFAISIILGSLAFSAIIFELSEIDSELFDALPVGDIILKLLPIFWTFFLGIFLALAIFGIKHTKKGYKFNPLGIFTASIAISLMLGSVIFAFDVGEKTDKILAENIGSFHGIRERHDILWSNPEHGLLGGRIMEINWENESLTLRDFNEKNWNVNYRKTPPQTRNVLQVESKIRAIGKQTGETEFEAGIIRPDMPKKAKEKLKDMFRKKNNGELGPIMYNRNNSMGFKKIITEIQ